MHCRAWKGLVCALQQREIKFFGPFRSLEERVGRSFRWIWRSGTPQEPSSCCGTLAQKPPSCYCSLLHLTFGSWPSSCLEPSPLSFPFPLELWVRKKFAFPVWHLLFCQKKNVRYLPRFEAGQLALGKNFFMGPVTTNNSNLQLSLDIVKNRQKAADCSAGLRVSYKPFCLSLFTWSPLFCGS